MDRRTLLHGDCTGNSIDNRGKLNDCAIAHQLDDAASMVCDQRVYDLRTKCPDRAECTRLIRFDQT